MRRFAAGLSVCGSVRTPRRSGAWPLVPPPMVGEAPAAGRGLTRREREVLGLLCRRLGNPEIAARLYLSPRTVEAHVANLFGKLGVATRREAMAAAARRGLA